MVTLRNRRPKRVKVSAYGRQGRPIYDELFDEVGSLPTEFELPMPVAQEPKEDELVTYWVDLKKQAQKDIAALQRMQRNSR